MKEDIATFTNNYLKFLRSKMGKDFPNISVHNLVDFSCILEQLSEIHPVNDMTLIGIPCDGGWSYGSYYLDFLKIDNPNKGHMAYLVSEGEHAIFCDRPYIYDKFTITPSRMAYWQVCLLEDTWRFLPLRQHALYSQIDYIFNKEDLLKQVAHIPELVSQANALKCNFSPRIRLHSTGATVTFYLWSDWGGLAQVTIHYKNEGGYVTRADCHTQSILAYECGICF